MDNFGRDIEQGFRTLVTVVVLVSAVIGAGLVLLAQWVIG
jgi:hypothetical protein